MLEVPVWVVLALLALFVSFKGITLLSPGLEAIWYDLCSDALSSRDHADGGAEIPTLNESGLPLGSANGFSKPWSFSACTSGPITGTSRIGTAESGRRITELEYFLAGKTGAEGITGGCTVGKVGSEISRLRTGLLG